MSTEISSIYSGRRLTFGVPSGGEVSLAVVDKDMYSDVNVSRYEFLAAVAKELDVKFIEVGDLPEVRLEVGRGILYDFDSFAVGAIHRDVDSDPDRAHQEGLALLAISRRLREHQAGAKAADARRTEALEAIMRDADAFSDNELAQHLVNNKEAVIAALTGKDNTDE